MRACGGVAFREEEEGGRRNLLRSCQSVSRLRKGLAVRAANYWKREEEKGSCFEEKVERLIGWLLQCIAVVK